MMRPIARLLPALALGLLSQAAAAAPSLDPAQFEALATARTYAADQSLIFYCLRANDQQRPFFYVQVQGDLEDTRAKLKAAGATPLQNAEIVQAVLANVRFPPKDAAKDPALDQQCTERKVEEDRAFLKRRATPLFMRPPFNQLGR